MESSEALASAVRSLGTLSRVAETAFDDIVDTLGVTVHAIDSRLRRTGIRQLESVCDPMRGMRAKITELEEIISGATRCERSALRSVLMTTPLPAGNTTGHFHSFTADGEPAGVTHEPAPLTMPAVIDMTIATQGMWKRNCDIVGAIRAVAAIMPDTLKSMVKPDPDDSAFVIVRVHGGTYRLRATLPAGWATSPDGSNLAGYLEKAAAAHLGSWDELDGGNPAHVLHWLVGDRFPYPHSMLLGDMTDAQAQHIMARRPCVSSTFR